MHNRLIAMPQHKTRGSSRDRNDDDQDQQTTSLPRRTGGYIDTQIQLDTYNPRRCRP